MSLSQDKKDKYVKSGNCCPYCEGEEVTGDTWESDDNRVSRDMYCPECEKYWTDIYTLTEIIEEGG